ncbi:MAG: hypothetical protein IMZ57_04095 [Acidobacteria bacterium]|nr:hypothetical protein [Acidobacteriota bacterium]
MALTMAGSEVDAWASVSQNTVREGAVVDLSDSYGSVLHIDAALGAAATAHVGTRFLIQVSSAAADDEFWTTLHDIIALVGTNDAETILDEPLAAGATHIHVASTTAYEVGLADGGTIQVLLVDATSANSELIRIVSCVNDASIDILDGTKREHAVGTPLSYITATFTFELPIGTLRARVIVDNTYDFNGAIVLSRTRVTKVTAVA